MSRENVEVVRSIYRAFARRDRHALVADLDASIQVHDRPSHPDASVYEGPEGFLHASSLSAAETANKRVPSRAGA